MRAATDDAAAAESDPVAEDAFPAAAATASAGPRSDITVTHRNQSSAHAWG